MYGPHGSDPWFIIHIYICIHIYLYITHISSHVKIYNLGYSIYTWSHKSRRADDLDNLDALADGEVQAPEEVHGGWGIITRVVVIGL